MALRSDNSLVFLVGPGQAVQSSTGNLYVADSNGNLEVPFNDAQQIQSGPRLWEVVNSGDATDLALISGVPDVELNRGYVAKVGSVMCFWMGVSTLLPSGWIDQSGIDAVLDS